MSERGDFFASASKSASTKPLPKRGDFFSGKIKDDDLDTAPDPAVNPPSGFSSPYAYFTPEVQRSVGNDGSGARPLDEVAPGINQGVAHLLGLPVTTLVNAGNLASSGFGFLQSKITGDAPSPIFDPVDPASVPLTGAWNEQMLNSTPMGDVTSVRDPNSAVARIIHETAAGIPGGLIGGGPVSPNIIAGAAGGAGSAVASELGADPATQATISLLAGAAGAKGAERASAQPKPKPSAQDLLNEKASSQSMGAAGAAVDLQKLSPDLKVAVEKAVQQTGGAVNPEAMARHIQADSLPVKVNLSEGQVLGDERLISLEQNARGKHDAYSKGFAEQSKALTENLRVMRDEVGPEVFSTNPVEHADTIIGRYKAIDEAAKSEISAKYKALEDANGGQFPVNGDAFIKSADSALSKKMKGRYLPKEVRGDIEEFRDNAGYMTFEQFENLRTNLATEARKAERSGDGNAAAAVNIVRRELENLPMSSENAKVKALADDARASAKARFDSLDDDPAYKAAVNDSTPPDAFVQKFLINGTRDNTAKLSKAMSGDERAAQTIKVATLEHLRKSAGIDNGYNGNFTQAGYNKALQALEPKLGFLLDAKTAETARTLGDVARYSQFQPRGSFVNNSNTFVSAAAEKAADALEGAINYKTGGIPIASHIRKTMNENKVRKQAEKTFAPGAGLTRLSDLTKIKDKK